MDDLSALVTSVDSCDSVMDLTRRRAAAGLAPLWSALLARRQSAGRGSHGRRWASPPGGLYAAVRLPIGGPFDRPGGPFLISAVITEALSAIGYELRLKWPNDLVGRHQDEDGWRKIGGILLEKSGDLLIAGIGVNVLYLPETVPGDGRSVLSPGCLARLAGSPESPDAAALWPAIHRALRDFFPAPDGAPAPGAGRLLWLGQEVGLRRRDGLTHGRLSGVRGDGALLLADPAGRLTAYHDGELLGPT